MGRQRTTEGQFIITSSGVEASASSLGAAMSKAQTLASRLQKAGLLDVRSFYIRRLGEDRVLARVEAHPDVIVTISVKREIKTPPPIRQVTPATRDSRGFVPSPSGGRVRRIPPVE